MNRLFNLATSASLAVSLTMPLLAQADKNPIRPASAAAQSSEASVPLSVEAQSTLDRLTLLGKGLPDGPWAYHPGDIAHGEDPSLDDHSWPIGAENYDTTEGSVWFRRSFVMPATSQGYKLSNVRLFFQFHAFAHGAMPEILYVNGRRIAMGDNMEPVELVDHIEPGETIHIAVKLLHTADKKHISPASYMLRFDPARPDPVKVEEEIRSAAVLLPLLGLNNASQTVDDRLLDDAARKIDIQALDKGDDAAFDASLRSAQDLLEPLRAALQRFDISLVGNSHIDTAWVWPWTETVDVVHRTFSTALQLMPEYPNYIFTQSVALYSSWMQEKYPDVFNEMKTRTQEGRWEPVGGMWVEPDLNMPGGESLVRQLLLGKNFFSKQMGYDVKVGWNPDSFGYNWQIPQIYKRSGIDYFVTQKLTWNETNKLPLKLFWWQSPDGSRVLTYFPGAYDQSTDAVGSASDLAAAARVLPGDKDLMRLYGVGDHGGGPTRVMLDQAQAWMQPDVVYPKTNFTTSLSFFKNVQSTLADPAKAPVWTYKTLAQGDAKLPITTSDTLTIPVWNDELYLEFHRGAYTSQARQKHNMRFSEQATLNAEALATLGFLGGSAYPSAELTDAWKKVLFNQFHDLAAGTGTSTVYLDAQRDYDSVYATDASINANALGEIASHADTRAKNGETPVFVFNPLAWQRTDLAELTVQLAAPAHNGIEVRDAAGDLMPSQVLDSEPSTSRYHLLVRSDSVPSLGFKVLYVRDARQSLPTDLKASATTLENDRVRVDLDPATGCIIHLIDKSTHFDDITPNRCGNELQTFVDLPKQYDAWNIDADALDQMTPIHEVDSIALVENGPLRAVLRVKRHFGHSTFLQDITLYAGMDRVDIKNDFDWEETHTLLKAAFPVAAYSQNATYEIPFAAIDRPTTRSNSVDRAKFEVPALRWADLGNGTHGLTLLNDSKYGYDAAGNVLRLSLLRSPTYPDPNTDHGRQQFIYSLYPHAGTWQEALSVRAGYALNAPLLSMQTFSHQGDLGSEHAFLSIDSPNVVFAAIKKAEDSNDVILRVYESEGKPATAHISLPGIPVSVSEVGMMEDSTIVSIPLMGNVATLQIKPFEIHTLRICYTAGASLWSSTLRK
jgi:alpha-mannosidase